MEINDDSGLFQHRQVMVKDISIHIVESGISKKSTLLFLHGWPENWMAFKQIMISLRKEFHVVAIDLPGIGKSKPHIQSNDKLSIAKYVKGLIDVLELDDVTLVGHDVGGQIVFSYLHAYPGELSKAVIMNVAVPGIDPWEDVKRNPYIWHFAFHAIPELPETLITGKVAPYFDYFYDTISAKSSSISKQTRASYVASYSSFEALKTGFDWYRAFPQDEKDNINFSKNSVNTPVLYLRESKFDKLDLYLTGLREGGLLNVQGKIIPNSGHFSPDEQPDEVVNQLKKFIDSTG
jgi:pimeloyl-ACP methyl ester carboxylesterase